MHLYLVRHGAASSSGPISDFDRILTPRGESEAVRLGEALRRLAVGPLLVRCSPAQRCRRTAEIIAEILKLPEHCLCNESALLTQDGAKLLESLAATLDTEVPSRSLLLVGHQPGLERLSRWLLAPQQTNSSPRALHRGGLIWEPATCACFELDNLPPKRHSSLEWILPQDILKAL